MNILRINGNFLPSFAFLVQRKIESKLSINQRTPYNFRTLKKQMMSKKMLSALFSVANITDKYFRLYSQNLLIEKISS